MKLDAEGNPAIRRGARDGGVGVLGAWWSGWKAAVGMPGILLLKWLVNLALAVAVVSPVALLLSDGLGHSALAEQAFARVGADVAIEFGLARQDELRLAAVASIPAVLAYLLVNLYLTGGLLHRFRAGVREPWGEFFCSCGRSFWSLVRIGLFTLVLAAALLGPAHYGLARLVEALTEDAAGPQPLFYLTWLHWTILFLLASWVARVHDYARAALFLPQRSSARRAVVRAVAFTLQRGTKTLALWLLLVLPALALTAVLATAPVAGGVETSEQMWASAALGQALLLLRIAASFAALGGQMAFMRAAPQP
jgi:hypothetical protein